MMFDELEKIFESFNPPMGKEEQKTLEEYFSPNILPKNLVELLHQFNGFYDSNTNKYPGTERHYIDGDAFSEVQQKLNPNMYDLKQKGCKSPTGVTNMCEIENLHQAWG